MLMIPTNTCLGCDFHLKKQWKNSTSTKQSLLQYYFVIVSYCWIQHFSHWQKNTKWNREKLSHVVHRGKTYPRLGSRSKVFFDTSASLPYCRLTASWLVSRCQDRWAWLDPIAILWAALMTPSGRVVDLKLIGPINWMRWQSGWWTRAVKHQPLFFKKTLKSDLINDRWLVTAIDKRAGPAECESRTESPTEFNWSGLHNLQRFRWDKWHMALDLRHCIKS